MSVLTHFAGHDFIAIAADLDQGSGSRVERCKFITMMVMVSLKAKFVVALGHGSFSCVTGGNFTEKLVIDFAQWAGHIAHGVLMMFW